MLEKLKTQQKNSERARILKNEENLEFALNLQKRLRKEQTETNAT